MARKTQAAAAAAAPETGDAFPAFAALVKALKATLKLDGVSQRGLGRAASMSDGNIRRALTQGSGISNDSWLKLAAASPEGAPLRELLRDYALPSLAPQAHAVRAADDGRTTVPFSAIVLGPNYRTTLAEEDIEGLAQSILQKGILQNVLVRPLADGKLELRGGQRRYRAVELLIKRGDAKADFPVPVLIRAMEDDEALALSIVENIQKVDVHPVEEAEGFRQLRDSFGWSTSKIAEALGGKERLRYVQQRLNIVDKLTPSTRTAFHENRLNLDQARALWALPAGLQSALLEEKRLAGFSADDIRRDARARCASSKHALFKIAEYEGERFSDVKETYFVDIKQFSALQEAAIAARIEALRAKWSDVIIVTGGWIDTSGYEPTKDKARGVAFVLVNEPHYKCGYRTIKVQEGYCKRAPQPGSSAAEARPAVGLAKRTLEAAHHLKTIELQRAVAAAPARVSMALTIISLLPAEYSACLAVQIDRRRRMGGGAQLASFNTTAEHLLAKLLADFAKAGMVEIARDAETIQRISVRPSRRPDFFRALLAAEQLDRIFAAAIARDVGSFPGFEPRYGDDQLVVAIAEETGATLQGKWKMTEPYLDAFKKDQLGAIARASIGDFAINASSKKKDSQAAILTHPDRNADWLAPELHYGTGAEIAEAVSAMLGVTITAPDDRDAETVDDDFNDDEPEQDGDDEFAGTDEEAA